MSVLTVTTSDKKTGHSWSCPACTFKNTSTALICNVCSTAKGENAIGLEKKCDEHEVYTSPSHPFDLDCDLMFIVEHQYLLGCPKPVACPVCTMHNNPENEKCKICNTSLGMFNICAKLHNSHSGQQKQTAEQTEFQGRYKTGYSKITICCRTSQEVHDHSGKYT